MSVDYVVNLPCPVKDALPTATLVDLVKSRNAATAILARARAEGDQEPPSAITVGRVRQTPHGDTMANTTLEELLDETQQLQRYEHHCAGCPANAAHEAFGCYSSINYPILASGERWLMDRLPASLDGAAGRLLRDVVEDFDYDGGMVREMRKHGMFFEQRAPLRRAWRTGLLGRWTLTSDQLLQMMIGLGNLQAAHCALLALLLGVVSHDSPLDLLRDRAAWRRVFGAAHVDADMSKPQSEQWAAFLNALAIAAALDTQIIVDA